MSASRTLTSEWSTSALIASWTDQSTARESATSLWVWNSQNNYGGSSTVSGMAIKEEGPVTIGGLQGYKITGTVSVKGLDPITGDDVQIVVLLRPDNTHAMLLTASTIDDAQSKSEVSQIWDSLRVS